MKTYTRALAGLILPALLAAAPVPPAHAQKASPTAVLTALDTDKDGTLDWSEVSKAATARFQAANPDNDGTLDAAEASKLGIGARLLHKFDTDKDGTLDQTEYLALVKDRFARADKDHDGTLDAAELSSRAGRSLLRLIQ
jgi:Ca2+-binding EF-hand superfamily protein